MLLIRQLTEKGAARTVERVDTPVSKVTDEHGIAELAEVARCEHDAPRRIERSVGREAPNEVAVRVKDIHKAVSRAPGVVLAVIVLFRIRDVELAAEVLDAER